MPKEFDQSFNAEQRLIKNGITQEEISSIRNATRLERTGHDRPERGLPDVLSSSNSNTYSGDYQKKLQEELGISPVYISKTVERTVKKGLIFKKTETKREVQKNKIQPVTDIAQEIASYTKTLSEKGEHPVTVVDFGSGATVTTCRAAHILKEEIAAKRVRLIATNIDEIPTTYDIPLAETVFSPQHASDFSEALKEKTIEFVSADILELYEYMKGEPVHLLVMVDTFAATQRYNDTLLKITGEMLHPDYGTAVFGLGSLKDDPTYPALGRPLPRLKIINNGLEVLRQKGFEEKIPLQITDGTIHMNKPIEHFPFEIYQAKDAPPFALYTEGREIKENYLGF